MPKMTEAELKALLGSQYNAAMAASNASKLSAERADALSYYNGDMSTDMPALPGRSAAVSLDVADTIEGIMPQLMEVFAGSEEVVKFQPVGPEDVQAAGQETDYINHVFMNMNPGFMVLYAFIKDALLSKVGVVKIWWEEDEESEEETYLDKTDDEYALIVADQNLEVTAHSFNPETGLHDVTVESKKSTSRAKVMGVPPEEFGIEMTARSIHECNYCFHRITSRTEAELIEQGFDPEQIKSISTYRAWSDTEEVARDTVDESSSIPPDSNSGTRIVEIVEHYIRMDYDGEGEACLYRVTTGGSQGIVLRRNGKLDIEEFDVMPFAAMTPVIVTHRFYGKSLADLVMDIQRIKTALWRGALDSLYVANNPRVVVAESHANSNTLDDLLVSRPNQIVRVKALGGIEYQKSIDISPSVYPALEYMDSRLESRTGVTKQGQGLDPNALLNQSATAANIVDNASKARVRLIARIFAETGIRDMFWLLHRTVKKHADKQKVVQLRNQWVPVDPREWKTRDDLTVHVGLGTGSRAQQLAELQILAANQEKALQGGFTNLVNAQNLYATATELVKALGRPNVDAFFTDPKTQPAPQAAPDPKMMELQAKNEIEKTQAEADIATQNAKTQAEIVLQRDKFDLESKLAILEHELIAQREERAHELEVLRAQLKLQSEAASHSMKIDHAQQMHDLKTQEMSHPSNG